MLQLFFGETELRAALPIYFPQELMGIEIWKAYVPGSKLPILGMVIPSLIGNPYNGYINPSYWVDEHPLLYGNTGSLDPGTYLSTSLKDFTNVGETWACNVPSNPPLVRLGDPTDPTGGVSQFQ